ncbi:MAG: efflux RND transporter periplasmic adaptor subunit, partial [Planctomycetota bacterium]
FTLALTAGIVGCGQSEEEPPPPPAVVVVDTPQRRDVTSYYYYTGNLEAFDTNQIRARVPGFLTAKHFEPSTRVEAGTKLFTLEKEPYEIAVQSARAALRAAEADRELARVERDRIQEAFDRDAANDRELQTFISQFERAEAEVLAARAALRQAELDLSYTDVTSAIAGQVDRELVDVGDLVGMDGPTLLTTVVRKDPIYVLIDVSEAIVLEYVERGKTGDVGEDAEPPTIEVSRENDGDDFPYVGQIDFVDSSVGADTATLTVRGVLPNPDFELFPGTFVRARVPYGKTQDAVLIPENALGTSLDGKFVLTVDDDNTVHRVPVELGERQSDGLIVVNAGLEGHERIVVRGLQKARPGETVDPKTPDEYAADPQ